MVDKSKTIPEFCEAEQISLSSYYKMKRAGRGPKEIRPAGEGVRITPEAHAEWRRDREQDPPPPPRIRGRAPAALHPQAA